MNELIKSLAPQIQNKFNFAGMTEAEIANVLKNTFVSIMQEIKEDNVESIAKFDNSKEVQKVFAETLYAQLA